MFVYPEQWNAVEGGTGTDDKDERRRLRLFRGLFVLNFPILETAIDKEFKD